MRFLTAEIFLFVVFAIDYIRTEPQPDGKNVCLTTENYEESIMVPTQVVEKKKKFCWKFRCTDTRIVNKTEIKVYKRTRIVPKCCDGYTEDQGGQDCVPACSEGCGRGNCVAPEVCDCTAGYYGPNCEKDCPEGRWGKGCLNECKCSVNGRCRKDTGCECEPGWVGESCETPCQQGYYGLSCLQKCECDPCHPANGKCIATVNIAPDYEAAAEYATEDYLATARNEIPGTFKSEVNTELVDTSELELEEKTDAVQVSSQVEEEEKTKFDTEFGKNAVPVASTTAAIKSIEENAFSEFSAIETRERIEENEVSIPPTSKHVQSLRENAFSIVSVTEPIKGNQEGFPDSNLKSPTEVFVNAFTDLRKSSEEETSNEKEIKFQMRNEFNFLEGLETFSENPHVEENEATGFPVRVPEEETFDKPDNKGSRTFWITFTDRRQTDAVETDDLMGREKGTAPRDSLHTKFHFFASWSILSGVALIISVIAAKWIVVSHRRKLQKLIVTAQKEKMLQAEQVKYPGQNLFWVKDCHENSVHLSDIDINRTVPILQTFKPLSN